MPVEETEKTMKTVKFSKSHGMNSYQSRSCDELTDGMEKEFPEAEAKRLCEDFPLNFKMVGGPTFNKASKGPTGNK